MRPVLRFAVCACLAASAGCGYVAGNYPVQYTESQRKLPEKFEVRGEARPVVWNEPGAVRGFLVGTLPVEDMVRRLEEAKERGYARADQELPLFRPAAQKGLAQASLVVFAAPTWLRELKKGMFRIEFGDGTTATDEGALLFGPDANAELPKSTLYGAVIFDGAIDEEMAGRRLLVFLPGETLGREIKSIALAGATGGGR